MTPTAKATNSVIPKKVAPNQSWNMGISAIIGNVRRICAGSATIRRDHFDQETASPAINPTAAPSARPVKSRRLVSQELLRTASAAPA